MTYRIAVGIAALAVLWTPAGAQEGAQERVELRVSAQEPGGRVEVDRGTVAGLALGDVVTFFPREGSPYVGHVVSVDERSSVVQLLDPSLVPPPGTRGEARVPTSRFAEPEGEGEAETGKGRARPPAGQQQGAPEHPPWKASDDEWSKGMPLLTEVEAVRPEERKAQYSGRLYVVGDQTYTTTDRWDTFWRAGADLLYENPFGEGGELHIDGELNYRHTDLPDEELQDNEDDATGRLDRFSYTWGGTRFRPERWQGGRFLQNGMPEFGVLDGLEWSRRLEGGDRFGFSVGFMPEPDEDYESLEDLQLAAFYHWEPRPSLGVRAGVQTTWHNGNQDRDLFVANVRYNPGLWNVYGTTWVDLYRSEDDFKDSGLELTQAQLSATRVWEKSGLNLSYSRMRFPDIERNEFVPPARNFELEENRNDRVWAGGWRNLDARKRFHGRVGVWDDEDESGGDVELGVEIDDLFAESGRGDVTFFLTEGQFTSTVGGRLSYRRHMGLAHWGVLYELARNDLEGFDTNADDQLMHRLRGEGGLHTKGGWSISVYVEVDVWDVDDALSAGIYMQRSF